MSIVRYRGTGSFGDSISAGHRGSGEDWLANETRILMIDARARVSENGSYQVGFRMGVDDRRLQTGRLGCGIYRGGWISDDSPRVDCRD